ncbi:hypothetical protein BH24ACT20_BH24ACT20_17210 [soil metagenome]
MRNPRPKTSEGSGYEYGDRKKEEGAPLFEQRVEQDFDQERQRHGHGGYTIARHRRRQALPH